MSVSVVEQVRGGDHFSSLLSVCRPAAVLGLTASTCTASRKHDLQANEARRLAVLEVQRLLATADDLKRLAALREDVQAKQQASPGGPATDGTLGGVVQPFEQPSFQWGELGCCLMWREARAAGSRCWASCRPLPGSTSGSSACSYRLLLVHALTI